MKILHISDEHIRDKDIEEIDRCLAFIVETARGEAPDLIVSAGDLFDSQDVKMGSLSAMAAIGFITALADIAPVAVVIGTPSHDGKAPEILPFARGHYPIVVASRPIQVYLEDGGLFDRPAGDKIPEAIITLIPQPTKQFFQTESGVEDSGKEIGQAMSALFAGFGVQAAQYPGVPHIVVGHWQTRGATMSNGQMATGRDIEVSVDQMMMACPDLICLGHIHLPQHVSDRAFYSGSIYATNIGEDHEHSFLIHGINTGSPTLPFYHTYVNTPCKRTVRIKVDATDNSPSPEAPGVDTIDGAEIRYEITTWQDEAGNIDKAGIEKLFMDAGALSVDIRINAIPRENVRAEAVLKAETLRDEIQAMADLRGEEVDTDVLAKADLSEHTPAEELIGRIVAGGSA